MTRSTRQWPVACGAVVGGDAGENPRQDARFGRDAAAAAGQLTKIGAGDGGFDFSKIANNGTTLAAGVALGGAATDWACSKDNVTGLTWEVKTTSGLRSSVHSYSWYSLAASNGGNPGDVGIDTCSGTLSAYSNECNTQNFIMAVNAASLCGAGNWRLPTNASYGASSAQALAIPPSTAPTSRTPLIATITGRSPPTLPTRPTPG